MQTHYENLNENSDVNSRYIQITPLIIIKTNLVSYKKLLISKMSEITGVD